MTGTIKLVTVAEKDKLLAFQILSTIFTIVSDSKKLKFLLA